MVASYPDPRTPSVEEIIEKDSRTGELMGGNAKEIVDAIEKSALATTELPCTALACARQSDAYARYSSLAHKQTIQWINRCNNPSLSYDDVSYAAKSGLAMGIAEYDRSGENPPERFLRKHINDAIVNYLRKTQAHKICGQLV